MIGELLKGKMVKWLSSDVSYMVLVISFVHQLVLQSFFFCGLLDIIQLQLTIE